MRVISLSAVGLSARPFVRFRASLRARHSFPLKIKSFRLLPLLRARQTVAQSLQTNENAKRSRQRPSSEYAESGSTPAFPVQIRYALTSLIDNVATKFVGSQHSAPHWDSPRTAMYLRVLSVIGRRPKKGRLRRRSVSRNGL